MSLHQFNLIVARAPGVVVVATDGDQALWSTGKARKPTRCALTDKAIKPGDLCYRPVGNQQYRYLRILASEMDDAVKALGGFQSEKESVE